MHHNPAVAAATEIKPGKYRKLDGTALYKKVISDFMDEWNVDPKDIDGLLIPPIGMSDMATASIFGHEDFCDHLGLQLSFATTMYQGGATYASMLNHAAAAVARSQAKAVLCLGAGKFPSVMKGTADVMAKQITHPQFEYVYGSFIPAVYALMAMRFMYERDCTAEDLAAVAVSSREWALLNPDAIAHKHKALTIEKVVSSRMIAEPFHLHDCSIPCEGGAAFLVTTEDIAKSISKQPAYVLGYGEHHASGHISQSTDLATMHMGVSGKKAYDMAGVRPQDIDVIQIYDAFTINPLMGLEELGFVEKKTSGSYFRDGKTAPGGEMPVNTFGGLLSYGHTGDASGMSPLVEGIRQTMGIAEERQQSKADNVLVHCYGGMLAEHITVILGRKP